MRPWQWQPNPQQAVLLDLVLHGPLARVDIAKRQRISQATVTRLTKPLLDAGIVREVHGTQTQSSGRPTQPLDAVASCAHVVGMKIMETSIHAVLLDFKGNVWQTLDTPLVATDVATVVAAIADTYKTLSPAPGCAGIGICLGGDAFDGRLVTSAHYLRWQDVDLASQVEALLSVPVVVENDVLAYAGSQAIFGHGAALRDFAVLTVGAGLGYALVTEGRVRRARESGIGLHSYLQLGEVSVGHQPGDAACTGLMSADELLAHLCTLLGEALTFRDVLGLAKAQHPVVLGAVSSWARHHGVLAGHITALTFVEHVIFSGEAVELLELMEAEVTAGIHSVRLALTTPISCTYAEGSATQWARGAGILALQAFMMNLDR